jgi:hypothetical protein
VPGHPAVRIYSDRKADEREDEAQDVQGGDKQTPRLAYIRRERENSRSDGEQQEAHGVKEAGESTSEPGIESAVHGAGSVDPAIRPLRAQCRM